MAWLGARGWVALFARDLPTAQAAVSEARALARSAGLVVAMPDLVLLSAMIAHVSGQWPDRYRADLLDTASIPDLAASVHDGQLCAVEVYLYGGAPYERVAAFARALRQESQRAGARRGEAFATVVLGEALLLSGALEPAEAQLEEGLERHRDLGAHAGATLAVQRLAELELARDRPEAARARLIEASALAHDNAFAARHLVQRVYGTRIRAAGTPDAAHAVVLEAATALQGPESFCFACDILLDVPAATACARVGDTGAARTWLERARRLLQRVWRGGGAWAAHVAEAEAALAEAQGERSTARARLLEARDVFSHLGHRLDAERCRLALEGAG